MRFRGQREKGRLCAEAAAAAAGAAVTVAVLSRAPAHCSQDEVHRCSHSARWFIGCPETMRLCQEQARPRGRFRRGAVPYETRRREGEREREREGEKKASF